MKRYVAYNEEDGVVTLTRQEAVDRQKISMEGRFEYTDDESALEDFIVTHYAWETDEAVWGEGEVRWALASIDPMPRGERLAAEYGHGWGGRLWQRLCDDSPVMREVSLMTPAGIRRYARPLRKAREERKLWRKEVLLRRDK